MIEPYSIYISSVVKLCFQPLSNLLQPVCLTNSQLLTLDISLLDQSLLSLIGKKHIPATIDAARKRPVGSMSNNCQKLVYLMWTWNPAQFDFAKLKYAHREDFNEF